MAIRTKRKKGRGILSGVFLDNRGREDGDSWVKEQILSGGDSVSEFPSRDSLYCSIRRSTTVPEAFGVCGCDPSSVRVQHGLSLNGEVPRLLLARVMRSGSGAIRLRDGRSEFGYPLRPTRNHSELVRDCSPTLRRTPVLQFFIGLSLFFLSSSGYASELDRVADPSSVASPSSNTDLSASPVAEKVSVFERLDGGDIEPLLEMSPKKLRKLLERGRRHGKTKPFEKKRSLEDRFGRKTDLYLIVPAKPTGVLFVLHGLNGNGSQLKDMYRRFAAKHRLVIAAPTAQKEPAGAKNEDSSARTDQFRHWWSYHDGNFVFSALSELKKEFPIDPNRVYLSGYSMGGFGTWNIGLRYPDRFAALVPMAGGISRAEYVQSEEDTKLRRLLLNAAHIPVYFLHGDNDSTVPVRLDRRTRDQLVKYGYEHKYVEVSGGSHLLDVRPGSKLLKGVLGWLAPRKRTSHPRTVKFYSLGKSMNQAYWVRIDEFDGETAEVTASVPKKNVIKVDAKGVAKLTLFIDSKLHKLGKKVRVDVNGKELFHEKVTATSESLVESWLAREDRELLYSAKVTIELPKP